MLFHDFFMLNIIMDNQNSNLTDQFVFAINLINSAFTYDVYVPSLDKNVPFRQLTTGQEKTIVKSSLNDKDQNMFKVLVPILQTNCMDQTIKIEDLTLVDLYAIILKTRIYSIGESIQISLTVPIDSAISEEEKNKDAPEAEIIVNNTKKNKEEKFLITLHLNDIYNTLLKKSKDLKPEIIKSKTSPLHMTVGIPTVKVASEITDQILLKTQRLQNDGLTGTDIDNAISNEYLDIEPIKYIKNIFIENTSDAKAEKKFIEFGDLSFDEKVKILDELPNEITVKLQTTLVPYITTISDLTIYNVSHRGKTYTNNLDILNFDFFTVF